MKDSVCVRAPGTLMLMGEHAVLHGRCALGCAVNQYVTVRAMRRQDRRVSIRSSLGEYCAELDAPKIVFPHSLRFAGAALRRYVCCSDGVNTGSQEYDGATAGLQSGVDVVVESDFSSTVGLGSSAAVTVAVTAAMRALCGLDTVPDTVFNDAYAAVLEVQGRGSGTDVAACVLGGITRYRMQPREMETMSLDLPLLLVYCGYKTPTVEVIERLDAERCRFPRVYERIFDALDACSVAGWDALRAGNIESFGQIMDIHQGLMETMALSTPELDEIIAALRALPGVMGAKITGSGLGDCALAVGAGPWKHDKYEQLPVAISREGVTIDY